MTDQNNFSRRQISSQRILRVAYDASVLGYAQYGGGGRTGVFRLADNWARGLVRSAQCDLSFCGSENYRMWVEAQSYLSSDPELRAIPQLSFGNAARVYRYLGKFYWALAEEKTLPFPTKVFRRALGQALRNMDHYTPPLKNRLWIPLIFFIPAFTLCPVSRARSACGVSSRCVTLSISGFPNMRAMPGHF